MSSVSICIIKILTHQGVFRWQGPRKWKAFAVKSFSLFFLVMEATILKTWSRDRNYTITNAHGRHERRHFRRVSVVCACFLAQIEAKQPRSAFMQCAEIVARRYDPRRRCRTPFDPATSSWKNFKTLIKADGGKCISDGENAVCRLIMKPLLAQHIYSVNFSK